MELDHVFILCEVGGPEAAVLSRLGLKEGPPNTHPGQGTACRRFLFSNAYLELLWVSDEAAARSEGVPRTRLWERWSQRGEGACGFGIVLRPSDGDPAARPPFPTWAYAPEYLPAGLAIDVAVGTPLSEAHAIGAGEITGITVGVPGSLPKSRQPGRRQTMGWSRSTSPQPTFLA